MPYCRRFAMVLLLMCALVAAAKDKKKRALLPADVLQARTVLVMVDPYAGMAVDAPMANRTAQQDVEKALMLWGRFTLAPDASTADLIISVRKGNGKIAQPTVGGMPDNNNPVVLQPANSGGRVGGHTGTPPMGDSAEAQTPSLHPQAEVGDAQDMFVVYRGKRDNPLDYPAVWRYSAKDALWSPTVPAVDEFRKLVVEAEKRQAAAQ